MANTCCPPGLIYVDSAGNWTDVGYGGGVTGVVTPGQAGLFNGSCVSIGNVAWGSVPPEAWVDPTRSGIDPIPCLCCPPNMIYSSFDGMCHCDKNPACLSVKPLPPIPCLKCVCPPDDPPQPEPCLGCQSSSGMSISFSFQSDVKQCVDCNPQDFILTNNPKLNCFVPYYLISPIINFKLD